VRRLFLLIEFLEGVISPYDFLGNMTRGYASLTHLGLSRHCSWDPLLIPLVKAAAQYHPHLQELQLRLSFRSSDNDILNAMLDTLAADISAFEGLQILDLNGSRSKGPKYFRDGHRAVEAAVFLPVLKTWRRACPTLRKVTFPNGSLWICTAETAAIDPDWVCDNPYNFFECRIYCWCGSRIPGAERWTAEPTFSRDLKRPWPSELEVPIQTVEEIKET